MPAIVAAQDLRQTARPATLAALFGVHARGVNFNPDDQAPSYDEADNALTLSNGADPSKGNDRGQRRGPRKISENDQRLIDQAGYNHVALGREDNPGEEAEAARRKSEERNAQLFEQVLDTIDDDDPEPVMDTLNDMVGADQSWLDFYDAQPSLTENDLLHADKAGRPVPADHPEARAVRTVEEKQEMERRMGGCSAFHAQDEVTIDGKGRLVTVKGFEQSIRLREQLDGTRAAMDDLKAGRTTPATLDPALKDRITAHRGAAPAGGTDPAASAPASVGNAPGVEAPASQGAELATRLKPAVAAPISP